MLITAECDGYFGLRAKPQLLRSQSQNPSRRLSWQGTDSVHPFLVAKCKSAVELLRGNGTLLPGMRKMWSFTARH